MHNNYSDKYLYNWDGVYQFIRRIPTDVGDYYGSSRIQIGLKTKIISIANRCARSITKRLEDYWLGVRLQKLVIPKLSVILFYTAAEMGKDSVIASLSSFNFEGTGY